MSYTNQTEFLKLPQYIATDIPSILTDFNGAMEKIDTNAKSEQTSITEAVQNAEQAKSLAAAAQAQSQANANSIGTLGTRVTSLENTSGDWESEITTLQGNVATAQTTANQAQTTARNAQTAATNAQSTANSNTNSIGALTTRVSNLEQGATGGGDVKITCMGGYQYTGGGGYQAKNFLGNAVVIWGEGKDMPGTGDAQIGGVVIFSPSDIEQAANTMQINIGGTNYYPLVEVAGNPFKFPTPNQLNIPFYIPVSQGNIPSAVSLSYMSAAFVYNGTNTYIVATGNLLDYSGQYLGKINPTFRANGAYLP